MIQAGLYPLKAHAVGVRLPGRRATIKWSLVAAMTVNLLLWATIILVAYGFAG